MLSDVNSTSLDVGGHNGGNIVRLSSFLLSFRTITPGAALGHSCLCVEKSEQTIRVAYDPISRAGQRFRETLLKAQEDNR